MGKKIAGTEAKLCTVNTPMETTFAVRISKFALYDGVQKGAHSSGKIIAQDNRKNAY